MPLFDFTYQYSFWEIFGLLIAAVWTLIWEGLGLWHAAKNNQNKWFIVILLFNTAGLLPIIYLIWFKPDKKNKFRNYTVGHK